LVSNPEDNGRVKAFVGPGPDPTYQNYTSYAAHDLIKAIQNVLQGLTFVSKGIIQQGWAAAR